MAGVTGGGKPPPSADDVERRLYDAHCCLLAAMPYRAVMLTLSQQPYDGIIRPFLWTWNFKIPNLGRDMPSSEELADMIEAFNWLVFLPPFPSIQSKIVAIRSQPHPQTGRPPMWTKIAKSYDKNPLQPVNAGHLQRLHAKCMGVIAARLENRPSHSP